MTKFEVANLNLVKNLLRILNKPDSLITFVKDRLGHDLRYAIDHRKITNELNWNPEINLDVGLTMTVDWYNDNKDWMNNIITKDYLTYYENQYKNR